MALTGPTETRFPADHPQRVALADEVHARPPQPMATPSRASCLAVLVEPGARDQELRHLQVLCRRYGATEPAPGAAHVRVSLGELKLTWERHGEFSTYTVFQKAEARVAAGETAVDPAACASDALPATWLRDIPGQTMAAVHMDVDRAEGAAAPTSTGSGADHADPREHDLALQRRFASRTVVGSGIAGGAAEVYTDFKLDDTGSTRLWLLNRSLSDAQVGRYVQRLFELEVYRVLALLALPIARRQAPRIASIETSLAELTDAMARPDANDEKLLRELSRLAAEIESGIAVSQFRFAACKAYDDLVRRRIAELGETRVHGLQTIDEFMGRRLTPAVATCHNAANRLQSLSERIGHASAMLATRVGIEREHQNQALLASMNHRAQLQVRLQQTVEGLSIAAIVYYMAGIVGYLAKGLASAGWLPLNPDVIVAVSIPVVALTAIVLMRRMKKRLKLDGDTLA
jgi:uncharacterized membrane-anchored protein